MSVFTKLNLTTQRTILVVNAPASFEDELARLNGVTVARDPATVESIAFAIAFVTRGDEVAALTPAIADKAPGDAVVWFAYPKGTSKRYRAEINRDTGWAPLGEAGFEPVRQVAIDEDWSAVRFRRAAYIKTMRRAPEHAMSAEGKARAGKGT
jgi:hypothetical protein